MEVVFIARDKKKNTRDINFHFILADQNKSHYEYILRFF